MERVTITLDELNSLRKEMQDRGVAALTVNIGLWSDTGLVNLQEVIHDTQSAIPPGAMRHK